MFSKVVWNKIDEAGKKRAEMINIFQKAGYTPDMDRAVNTFHTNSAAEILEQFPELEGYSVSTIKDLIDQCSREYVFDMSIYN